MREEGNFSQNSRLNDHFRGHEDFEDQQGKNGYGDRNKEEEGLWKFVQLWAWQKDIHSSRRG